MSAAEDRVAAESTWRWPGRMGGAGGGGVEGAKQREVVGRSGRQLRNAETPASRCWCDLRQVGCRVLAGSSPG